MVATTVNLALSDKKLCEAILRFSPHNAGQPESFHADLNRNCLNNYSFSHISMISR